MALRNKEIAQKLTETADLLDIRDSNPHRIRSYRNAARVIAGMTEDLSEGTVRKSKLEEIPEVGSSIAGKIREIINTGELNQLKKLRKKVPSGLLQVMELEQMGPERTKSLYEELGVKSIEELEEAAREGEVEQVSGFGKKTVENILEEIRAHENNPAKGRHLLADVEDEAEALKTFLEKELNNVVVAGSYRRSKSTVGDIDTLATTKNAEKGMDHFTSYKRISRLLSKGETRSSVVLNSGLQADLRIVKKRSHGAALLYFTGSKEHSIALRKIGQEKKLKVNEYGIFKGKKSEAAKTEKEMYRKLGLKYIEPELRENRGEIEAARKNRLPELVELEDIRGDLQTHTTASDGHHTLEDMVKAAADLGYEYYAVTDHSKRVTMANGLNENRLAKQIEEIDKLNKKQKNIRILKSTEVDILKDGSLDLSDSILKQLDVVVCSVHYNMKLSKKQQTKRILRAMENPFFNILAHPTGRRIGVRDEMDLDMKEIMKEAKDKGCFLEINASPDRLDLEDHYIRMAKETGLKLSISTDAHSTGQLDNMKYGIGQARRGWLEKDDVINTHSWKKLNKLLAR